MVRGGGRSPTTSTPAAALTLLKKLYYISVDLIMAQRKSIRINEWGVFSFTHDNGMQLPTHAHEDCPTPSPGLP